MHVLGKDSGGEYLCPVCRDRAMEHMLGELQVTVESSGMQSKHAAAEPCVFRCCWVRYLKIDIAESQRASPALRALYFVVCWVSA